MTTPRFTHHVVYHAEVVDRATSAGIAMRRCRDLSSDTDGTGKKYLKVVAADTGETVAVYYGGRRRS